jgi:hypothetical protein
VAAGADGVYCCRASTGTATAAAAAE